MKNLTKISLRQNAIYVPSEAILTSKTAISGTTYALAANLARLGFGVSEPLLNALNSTSPKFQLSLLNTFREVMGVHKNWTPLVKGWDEPTGESVTDHIITFFVNIFGGKGTKLACGHTIPANTFPLERYNGCPFCGTPFEFGTIKNYGQASKLKVLELWSETDIEALLKDLLASKTPLDATQIDSLKLLLAALPLPAVPIGMKETAMVVIDTLVATNQAHSVQHLFGSPTDVMRYLWYKKTGYLQIIEPKTIVKRHAKNNRHLAEWLDKSGKERFERIADLKLKYSRKDCAIVANWLNNLALAPEKSCEMMHPKRAMWVRFIRALRLAEYSKKTGFEPLAALLDVFYNQTYTVWQGHVNHYRLRLDADKTFALLKQRPGLFARSLFANILWFGLDETIAAFAEVIDKVPARLVFTLNMYAQKYFSAMPRAVKPLGGVSKTIPANQLVDIYDEAQLSAIKVQIEDLCLLAMKKRFENIENEHQTMFIDPVLFKMPVSIGDRSDNIQDLPAALMGTRFGVEGDTIRLFMQWGEGLQAQHLDLDLSAYISYDNKTDYCSFSQLVVTGCKHSGDIQYIPDKVGAAEYIDLNLNEISAAGAKYVTFVCNAYTFGSVTPSMVVGWMNSKYPMKVSKKTGVAYDPSCVQHQVRITKGLVKGLVFGVLDVAHREIVWLELIFQGQVVQQLDSKGVEALLAKLNAKLSIGNLLKIKAEAQGLTLAETNQADEVYTQQWAMNTANVTQLLVD